MVNFLDSAFPFIIAGTFIALLIGLIYKKNKVDAAYKV